MFTIFVGAICLLVGICVGIHVEYRNGYLDRHLHKPWPIPRSVLHEDSLDDCEQFNRAMIERRVIETPETLQ